MVAPGMVVAFFGLGSNLGDRVGHLTRAVVALDNTLDVTAVSALYESAPMYVTDQPPFLNMALGARTRQSPMALLRQIKALETALGRTPGLRFGPRVVDIDILFYGEALLTGPELEIPHPRLVERAFVLRPLDEIAAAMVHPGLGRTVRALLEGLPERDSVVRLSAPRPIDWLRVNR